MTGQITQTVTPAEKVRLLTETAARLRRIIYKERPEPLSAKGQLALAAHQQTLHEVESSLAWWRERLTPEAEPFQ